MKYEPSFGDTIEPGRLAFVSFSPNLKDHWNDELPKTISSLFGDDPQAFLGFSPTIVITKSSLPNAYASAPNTIVISRGLLDITHNPSELAFIVAHEAGHLFLRHSNAIGLKSPIDMEIEADAFAAHLLTESGFLVTPSVELIERVGKGLKESGISTNTIYPAMQTRLKSLGIYALNERLKDSNGSAS